MELTLQWLTETFAGKFLLTLLVSMVPVVELRFGIPFGIGTLGLPEWAAFLAAVTGNLIPVPFIIVYIRRIFQWLRRHIPRLNSLVDKLERKAHLKGQKVTKYKYLGLAIFVAVPLPGTGAWTGSLAAAFLDMPLRRAIPSVVAGVLVAGLIITLLTSGVVSLF
ncbi:MAG: small multi-drug export protein [Oscillospiraceae bacterium]|nr:small multi-drug export protein [Oscillospiraceae bacterium]MDE7004693.1 small multi-drug export protein [Oscillospiraceae bacterium]